MTSAPNFLFLNFKKKTQKHRKQNQKRDSKENHIFSDYKMTKTNEHTQNRNSDQYGQSENREQLCCRVPKKE
jgi:hypothetical protein